MYISNIAKGLSIDCQEQRETVQKVKNDKRIWAEDIFVRLPHPSADCCWLGHCRWIIASRKEMRLRFRIKLGLGVGQGLCLNNCRRNNSNGNNKKNSEKEWESRKEKSLSCQYFDFSCLALWSGRIINGSGVCSHQWKNIVNVNANAKWGKKGSMESIALFMAK